MKLLSKLNLLLYISSTHPLPCIRVVFCNCPASSFASRNFVSFRKCPVASASFACSRIGPHINPLCLRWHKHPPVASASKACSRTGPHEYEKINKTQHSRRHSALGPVREQAMLADATGDLPEEAELLDANVQDPEYELWNYIMSQPDYR